MLFRKAYKDIKKWFDSIRDNKRFKEIVKKAKYYLNRN